MFAAIRVHVYPASLGKVTSMSLIRVGSNSKFADGWDSAFGSRKKAKAAGKVAKATKKKAASPKKKVAKKKSKK
jgi:hypothetical protein